MIPYEDQRTLEDLHNRFVHAADRRDYSLLRSLYTDDAVEEHGGFNGPVDEFVTWLRGVHDYFAIATHTIGNLVFAVEGDTAESEGRGVTYLRMAGDAPFNAIVVNRHFDRYRRVDGRWLFARRSLCVDWAQEFAPADASAIVAGIPRGTMNAEDPLYAKVPNLVAALRARS